MAQKNTGLRGLADKLLSSVGQGFSNLGTQARQVQQNLDKDAQDCYA